MDTPTQTLNENGTLVDENDTRDIEALGALLKARLYRFSCVSPESLLAYYLDELTGSAKLTVAQHVRQCPHCARELAAMAAAQRTRPRFVNDPPPIFRAIQALLTPPPLRAIAVRDAAPEHKLPPLVYQAADLEIIVSRRVQTTPTPHTDVTGLIHCGGQVPSGLETARVELYRNDGLLAWEPVSARGQFAFAALERGVYEIRMLWQEQEICLPEMEVP